MFFFSWCSHVFFHILPLKYCIKRLSWNLIFFYTTLYYLWIANISIALVLTVVPFFCYVCMSAAWIYLRHLSWAWISCWCKEKHVYSLFMSPYTNTIMQWCGVGSCVHLFFPVWLHSCCDFTYCLCSNWPRLFLSTCWPAQVSPCPRMPLNPQQPSAFCLQLPETDPELLCLCSHTHLHWYAEAGVN